MNTLIDFWADWCQPCKKMTPVAEKVAKELEDKVHLVKVNADEDHNQDLLQQFNVSSIPTFVLIDEADQVLGTLVGARSEAVFRDWVESHVTKK